MNFAEIKNKFDCLFDRRDAAIEQTQLATEAIAHLCKGIGEIGLSEQQILRLARRLYWETDIAVASLRSMTGICGGQFAGRHGVMGRLGVKKCKACDRILYAHSRTELLKFTRESPTVCNKCRDIKNELLRTQRDREWEQTRIQQEDHLRELRDMPYSDYLQTDHWQDKRKSALYRAKYRCQLCDDGDTVLDVHHRTYRRLGCEHVSDLIVLCRECHQIFHKNGKLV